MTEKAAADPAFAEELVRDFLKLQEENKLLKEEVVQVKRTEQAAQQALRQARGISTYLKGKQGELKKNESKTQAALSQANGVSSFLKLKNDTLEERIKNAERIEAEAQQALRQARGISAYLKSKNASLEKKVLASKTEQTAEATFRQARRNSMNLRRSSLTNGTTVTAADLTLAGEDAADYEYDHPSSPIMTDDDDSSEEHEALGMSKDDTEDEMMELSLTNKLGMVSLVLIGVSLAMQ